ncbi:transcriptional regulator, LysR family [Rhizobiales bacterium GAS191]|nr:transcriptional regulator, LysR family [Rhizobiales bacterium GAS113]SED73021.1 transcriptional regulator, LysR family [Rhizobiales bacterium GAS191]
MSNHIPPLAALRAFAAVARHGSFARAASALHVSTSAVSHQIRGLELGLGARLLTRARNGALTSEAGVTEEGKMLLGAVETAFDQLGAACEAVRDRAKRARPTLAISANGSVASLWLAPRLAAFAALHPSVQWQMQAIETDPNLVREGLDLAILRCKSGTLSTGDRLLFPETLFPVCSPALQLKGTPQELLRHNLLQEDHHGGAERDWSTWLDLIGPGAGARVNLVRFSTFNAVIAAAIAGAGIALGRSPLIDDELRSGRLVRPFPGHALAGSFDFVIRSRPGAQRNVHVTQLRDHLLGSIEMSDAPSPDTIADRERRPTFRHRPRSPGR